MYIFNGGRNKYKLERECQEEETCRIKTSNFPERTQKIPKKLSFFFTYIYKKSVKVHFNLDVGVSSFCSKKWFLVRRPKLDRKERSELLKW